MEPSRPLPTNDVIADMLERIAALLEARGEDGFRVRAYRAAANGVRNTERSVAELVVGGDAEGLGGVPGVGRSIGAILREYVETGRVMLLARLEGGLSPETLLTSVPGIGRTLARRIHNELGVDTLEKLELAAHSGRLETLKGFGPRRARAIRGLLGEILTRSAQARAHGTRPQGVPSSGRPRPHVSTLLAADAEYRAKVRDGTLELVAPRRFNPSGDAWLPILHTRRDGWALTVLYSNTWRAHELGKTHDWVVMFAVRNGDEQQFTVVTEMRGDLAGRRVVRGREAECADHYGALRRARASAPVLDRAS